MYILGIEYKVSDRKEKNLNWLFPKFSMPKSYSQFPTKT